MTFLLAPKGVNISDMKVETDLKRIKKVAEKKWDENWEFRSFLKGYDIEVEELDAIVHRLLEEVCGEIDCTACGNCCREISPVLDQEDIGRLSRGLGISPEDVKKRFLFEDDKNYSEGFIFNKRPCPFLRWNLCSHYELRPEACRSFPHLYKEDFVFRLIGLIENYEVCPIVFNVYEQLKAELWHL
jgi:Fe-S-cluster containining protein